MKPSLFDRFCESMVLNQDRWRDGDGYDLSLLEEATPEELARIESLLTSRGVRDWRDVEALAALGMPRARETVRAAFVSGDEKTKAWIVSHAPGLLEEDERTEAIVAALEDEGAAGALTQTLLEVEEHHPRPVVDALLRGARHRDPFVAADFARMLLYLHGKLESPWDMAERPFLLRFQDEEREPLYRELCRRIEIEAASVE